MNPDQTTQSAAGADDLGFEAFRYIADEMSPQEAAAFEDRLAADQSAREAVAEAVLLSHAVAVAPRPCPASPSRPTRRGWQRGAACLVAIAACVAAVVALRLAGQPQPPTDDGAPLVASIDHARAERLIALWSQAAIADDVAADEAGTELVWLEESSGHETDADGEDEFGWMLAAVCIEPVPQHPETPDPPEQEEL